jgi:hypothetical protein
VNIRTAVGINVRVTPASQMMSRPPIHALRPASDAGLTQLGERDQRIDRGTACPPILTQLHIRIIARTDQGGPAQAPSKGPIGALARGRPG